GSVASPWRKATIRACPSGSFSVSPSKKPMRRTYPVCCARPPSGHSNTAPPSRPINSRRRIRSPHRRGLTQVLADLRQQLTRAVGLGNVGLATRGPGLLGIAAQSKGGDSDNGNDTQYRVGLDPARRLVAVEPGELDVHEDQIRPVRRRRRKPCFTVRGFNDFEIRTREQIPQDLPIVFLILDHQDALAHDCSACVSTRTGSVK